MRINGENEKLLCRSKILQIFWEQWTQFVMSFGMQSRNGP